MGLKKNEWWMVVDPVGNILRLTAATLRHESIHEFLSLCGQPFSWADYSKEGYRCVVVVIQESKHD